MNFLANRVQEHMPTLTTQVLALHAKLEEVETRQQEESQAIHQALNHQFRLQEQKIVHLEQELRQAVASLGPQVDLEPFRRNLEATLQVPQVGSQH